MALIALQIGVATGQGESHRVVIEARRLPGRRVVALLAGLRNPQCHVVRIAGSLKICQVASDAGRRRSLVFPTDVAGGAVQGRVHAGQREIRWRPGMVEFRSQPGVDRVALFALDGKTSGHVIGRGRLLKSILMARITLNR